MFQIMISQGNQSVTLPVPPQEYMLTTGNSNKTITLYNIGEINIAGKTKINTLSFSGYFPNSPMEVLCGRWENPLNLVNKLHAFKNSCKPVRVLITGTEVNDLFLIDSLSTGNNGGKNFNFDITFSSFKNISYSSTSGGLIFNGASGGNSGSGGSSTPAPTPSPPTNNYRTHTVKSGENLWVIAQKYLGNGARYMEIYNLNRDVISNPSLIYPGQVLKIPS